MTSDVVELRPGQVVMVAGQKMVHIGGGKLVPVEQDCDVVKRFGDDGRDGEPFYPGAPRIP